MYLCNNVFIFGEFLATRDSQRGCYGSGGTCAEGVARTQQLHVSLQQRGTESHVLRLELEREAGHHGSLEREDSG